MAAHAAEGFTAVKIKIGLTPDEDRQRTAAARAAMGDDGLVIVDYNANCTVATVRRSLARIRDLDPYWVEEPLPPEDSVGWRELRDVHLPLSGGEALYTRYGFRDPIAEHRSVNSPRPSTCGCRRTVGAPGSRRPRRSSCRPRRPGRPSAWPAESR
ncbi:MAG: hypothetical protein HOY75_47525 [Streptomyces sp.]|nr:hypothetical protein [Streptomyces sp.]